MPWFSRRFEKDREEILVERTSADLNLNQYGAVIPDYGNYMKTETTWKGPEPSELIATWLNRWGPKILEFRVIRYDHTLAIVLYQADHELD